jgi:3-oxoadipate enol-lactonase
VPEVRTEDAVLHVEVDGEGEPVTILAHGLGNSCRELARITPFLPGTKVRFDFRGHGHSSAPDRGYSFGDFARDLEAVADEYDSEIGCGTSLGAGAICRVLTTNPDRFRKLIFLLPAGLDRTFAYKERFLRTAALMEGKTLEEAIEAILEDRGRGGSYERMPWLKELDLETLRHLNPIGVPRAIREVIEDSPMQDREQMRAVTAPALLICREGDPIHPAEVGRVLAEVMPNAELMMYRDGGQMFSALPEILARVRDFLLG